MKKFKILTLIFLLFSFDIFASEYSHGISIFGDLKYSKNFKNFDYVNPNAKKGGKVKFGVDGTFNSLNNFILKGISASGLSYIYDSLMVGSSDEISSYYGLIAKAAKISDDKKSISFKLRKNAYFHDGKNIDVDDVIFTFKTLLKKGHPTYSLQFRDVKEVKKINKYEVKFIFENNKNRDLPFIIASLPILPKHFYEKKEFNSTSLNFPLGSGPYKIKELKAGHSITYERVKNYWANNLNVNIGRYNFDEITYDYYRDVNILVEAFKSKKFDFRQENIARNWATAYNIEAIKNGEIIKKKINHSLPAPMQAFIFNLRKKNFQNLALRKAITLAFDFEWLNKNIFYGQYKRTKSFFDNSEFGYKNFEFPESKGNGFNRKNLIKATKILEEAGYFYKEGWLFDENNNKISIEILINNESFKMVVAPFIEHLRRIGIDAKARFIEENQYKTRVNNFDYDMIVAVLPQNLIPGNELFAFFHSSQKNIKGGYNLIGLENKEIDELVAKIPNSKSKAELKNLTLKLDKLLLENYYVIAQWHNNNYRILYRNIFEMPKKFPKYSLSLDSWWIKED